MKDLIKESWIYYKSLTRLKIHSPILKANVEISRLAWDHVLQGNKSSSRKNPDKIRRLKMIKKIRFIIENAKEFESRKSGNFTYYTLKIQEKKITYKVVIRNDKNSKKILFSWMQR